MQVNWQGQQKPYSLHFSDLSVNDSFVIVSPLSRGAVYTKVSRLDRHTREEVYYMLELATGKLFDPTPSTVERVKVEATVDRVLPPAYR